MQQKLGSDVEAAAVQAYLVERTRQLPEPPNAAFQRRFKAQERNCFPGWNPDPHLIRSYQLFDVVLDGRFRGLFNDQGLIRRSNYLVPDEAMLTIEVDPARLVTASEDITVIIGCNTAYNDYFHWITQALPAIDFGLARQGQDRRIALALPPLTRWQEESLLLLGYAGMRRIVIDNPAKQYAFGCVEYCELLRGEGTLRQSTTMAQTFARLRSAIEFLPQPGRKLYVARTDTANRRMRNEPALIEALRKRDFEIVVPGAHSLSEQISLFRGASLVVGSHGAGLTNIVFCEPATIIYEVVPEHYQNASFCNLAHICDLRYWSDRFASEGDGPPSSREWESDTALVMGRIAEIEAIQAELYTEASAQTISAMEFLRGKPGLVPDLTAPEPTAEAAAPAGLWRRLFGRRAG